MNAPTHSSPSSHSTGEGSVRRRTPIPPLRLPALLLAAALILVACGDSPTAPANLPADHTVMRGGHFHAPGLNSPQGVCTACHGGDLRGGANGEPSCYSCHGAEWL